ncbi:SDR family oxidoreductase [Sphingosinicella sp. BN140058]|uniref:SDR family oxidoreductase n=1 Tax=Sphingosinicella sp. BN140058 TaxID=1892855 RepID=UPI0010124BD9|nr:SDR family oxidoreductase [Sphingosinicella sp. BN140058]QAY75239.1 SDR family NAD(P)-dependent oxidoreductase [Sphingosinicella sp. BN140058]
MSLSLKPLDQQVILITGASSGIGLATAKAAAAAGAKVVLAARTREALAAAIDQIKYAGGEGIFVVADVSRREDLEALARRAIDEYGRIDTWVNNAGVGIWGRLDEVSDVDKRQLFETNFWGTVYGSEIAVSHLRRTGGALINVGSVASDAALPLQGIYSASKHAVQGYTNALRMELAADKAPVSVTLIKPASIGTPMPQHVKNYTDREARFPPPIYKPEEVAAAILRAATHPTRQLFVGSAGRTLSALSRQTPRLMDWVGANLLLPGQVGKAPATPTDNLAQGRAEAQLYGDHQGSMIRPSAYTRAATNPAISLGAAGAVAAVGAGLFLWGRRDRARIETSSEEEVQAHPS